MTDNLQIPEEQGNNREFPERVGYQAPPVETQWKAGQSGNPGGRPKGTSIQAKLRAALELTELKSVDPKGNVTTTPIPDGMTVADVLAVTMLQSALGGDLGFVKEVLERTEGKVPNRVAGHDGGPVNGWQSVLSLLRTKFANHPELKEESAADIDRLEQELEQLNSMHHGTVLGSS